MLLKEIFMVKRLIITLNGLVFKFINFRKILKLQILKNHPQFSVLVFVTVFVYYSFLQVKSRLK